MSPSVPSIKRRRRRRGRKHTTNKQDEADDASTVASSGSDNSSSSNNCSRKHPLTKEQKQQYIGMDCEMVGVGPHGRRSALARVTVVDWNHRVLYDAYVAPTEEVTDYRYFVSGITEEDLRCAIDFETCRQHVAELLEGKILVGHALKNDLAVLQITHPWHLIRDTAKYEPFMKLRQDDGILWPRKLKDLTYEKLRRVIQPYGAAHCPIEDATSALQLYKLVRVKWEAIMEYKVQRTAEIQRQQQEDVSYQTTSQ